MITQIDAQVIPEEQGGWTVPKLTGMYSVTRIDGSKRDVNKQQLIRLLESEPDVNAGGCPACGAAGESIQEQPDGTNRICAQGCGPFRVDSTEEL